MHSTLTINGGSSSIRFALFDSGAEPRRRLAGKLERLGTPQARLQADVISAAGASQAGAGLVPLSAADKSGVESLVAWLRERLPDAPAAVGHRIVHGMSRSAPARVTPSLLDELRRNIPLDPEHLPREIDLIEQMQKYFPSATQVVCFDTAFHAGMPRLATLLPLPRARLGPAVRRYGFHGLSYTFMMQELNRLEGPAARRGRVILAHLGSGASLAAILDGRSVDTSMGFTPAAGLMMGTRSGDLDPGVLSYLARTQCMDGEQLSNMVNHEAGLLGVSETSADVRDLLDRENRDLRAHEALALFCYRAKQWIGSFAAVLGGLDTLVFGGGVGENAAPIRARICAGLEFLGVQIDSIANARQDAIISSAGSGVTVRVIKTDEELVIAQLTAELLGFTA